MALLRPLRLLQRSRARLWLSKLGGDISIWWAYFEIEIEIGVTYLNRDLPVLHFSPKKKGLLLINLLYLKCTICEKLRFSFFLIQTDICFPPHNFPPFLNYHRDMRGLKLDGA